MTMIKDAIDRVLEIDKPVILTIDEKPYTTKQVHPVMEPSPESLMIESLTGLVDYLVQDVDCLKTVGKESIHFIQIAGPGDVRLYGQLIGEFYQRNQFVAVRCGEPGFPFDSYLAVEDAIIKLQIFFEQTDTILSLLKVLGNLKDENIRTVQDDGTSQEVSAKIGIAKVEDVVLPNPVKLKPYRTFREVDQPESPFVLRLRQGRNGGLPECALFEADGGKWKLEAVQKIKAWLLGNDRVDIPVIC